MLERKRGELNIKKLGEIIKIARNKLNLTLSDLSRISDISEIELWEIFIYKSLRNVISS